MATSGNSSWLRVILQTEDLSSPIQQLVTITESGGTSIAEIQYFLGPLPRSFWHLVLSAKRVGPYSVSSFEMLDPGELMEFTVSHFIVPEAELHERSRAIRSRIVRRLALIGETNLLPTLLAPVEFTSDGTWRLVPPFSSVATD